MLPDTRDGSLVTRDGSLVMRKITGLDLERILGELACLRAGFFGVNSVVDNVPRQRALLDAAGVRTFRIDREHPGSVDFVGLVGVLTCSANEQLATIDMLCDLRGAQCVVALTFAVELLASATGLRSFLMPARDECRASDLRSIGFACLGALRDHEYAGGSYHDVSLFSYEVDDRVTA